MRRLAVAFALGFLVGAVTVIWDWMRTLDLRDAE